jgi:transcriptional regulator GlxA family with amidase domain
VLLNRLFVDDGDILTSAGVTTGIDLSQFIERLMPWPRSRSRAG